MRNRNSQDSRPFKDPRVNRGGSGNLFGDSNSFGNCNSFDKSRLSCSTYVYTNNFVFDGNRLFGGAFRFVRLISVLSSVVLAVVFWGGFWGVSGNGWQNGLENAAWGQDISGIMSRVGNYVVHIETLGGLDQVDGNAAIRQTTGIFFDKDGYIVSSAVGFAHQPTEIFVTQQDGRRFEAQVAATDANRNLVLLKAADQGFRCSVPNFADPNNVRAGQPVAAIGRSLDVKELTVSMGIVSSANAVFGLAVQTDARVSAVNYGGPLVDAGGGIVGILTPLTTARTSPFDGTSLAESGVAFAATLKDWQTLLPKLKEGGAFPVTKRLGIVYDNPNFLLAGTRVQFAATVSPAGKKGIKRGDVIVKVNDLDVKRAWEIENAAAKALPGDTIKLTIVREGQMINVSITL